MWNQYMKTTSLYSLSFFGKYVKKHLGESPNNYRKTHNYGK